MEVLNHYIVHLKLILLCMLTNWNLNKNSKNKKVKAPDRRRLSWIIRMNPVSSQGSLKERGMEGQSQEAMSQLKQKLEWGALKMEGRLLP